MPSQDLLWYKILFLGLFEDPGDSSDIAYSAKDTKDSLCFVPAFYGLHEPFLDNKAGCGFIGNLKSHDCR